MRGPTMFDLEDVQYTAAVAFLCGLAAGLVLSLIWQAAQITTHRSSNPNYYAITEKSDGIH